MTKLQKRLVVWVSVLWCVLYGIKSYGSLGVELVYSRQLYKYINYLKGGIFGVFPFSIGDVLYSLLGLAIILLFIQLSRSLWRRDWITLRKNLAYVYLFLVGLWVYFDLSWGLNYYRLPVMTYLEVPKSEITSDRYKQLVSQYIAVTNTLKEETDSVEWQIAEADKEITSYIREDGRWNDYLTKEGLKVKHPISSELISYLLVGGYFNPFSHEAQVNSNLPLTSYPYTVAHELAHKWGLVLKTNVILWHFSI